MTPLGWCVLGVVGLWALVATVVVIAYREEQERAALAMTRDWARCEAAVGLAKFLEARAWTHEVPADQVPDLVAGVALYMRTRRKRGRSR